MIRRFLGGEFVDPDELAMMQRVFDATCDEPDKKSPAAELAAMKVVTLFLLGFRDEKALLAEMRRRAAGG